MDPLPYDLSPPPLSNGKMKIGQYWNVMAY